MVMNYFVVDGGEVRMLLNKDKGGEKKV